MLTHELLPAFEGAFPSCIITASSDGTPNIANLTRVWYVDSKHVAIADQLLRKTRANLMEQPLALLKVAHPADLVQWDVGVRFLRAESEGSLRERISQDLRTVSRLAGVESGPEVRSALIFEVLSLRKCMEEALHLTPPAEAYGDLLHVLADTLGWERSSYWGADSGNGFRLKASRGVAGAGVDPGALEPMKRLAHMAGEERRLIRLNHIRSQWRYLRSIRTDETGAGTDGEFGTRETPPTSYLAIPVMDGERPAGVLVCEAAGEQSQALQTAEEGFLRLLGTKLGGALGSVQTITEEERKGYYAQVLERTRLEWARASEPFHSVLSARERQVALRVAQGCTNAEAGKQLFISTRTVTTHLERIYQKLGVTSRAALTRYIIEKGLVEEEAQE